MELSIHFNIGIHCRFCKINIQPVYCNDTLCTVFSENIYLTSIVEHEKISIFKYSLDRMMGKNRPVPAFWEMQTISADY